MDHEIDFAREAVECHGADRVARAVGYRDVRFRAEKAAGARFDGVEDCGLVWAEDLGGAVGQALVVDVQEAGR